MLDAGRGAVQARPAILPGEAPHGAAPPLIVRGRLRRIACLHTAQSNAAVFDAARLDLGLADRVLLRHDVHADLLADTERAGGLTPEIARRTGEALLRLCEQADAVLLTCSTLGPAVDGVVDGIAPVPVLRVDDALACEAVRNGGMVVALCAVETTLRPTRALFEKEAAATGAEVEVRLVPDAWAAFKAEDIDRYLALVAGAAHAALRGGASRVALAQASMAGAVRLLKRGAPVSASPPAGLRAAVAKVAAME